MHADHLAIRTIDDCAVERPHAERDDVVSQRCVGEGTIQDVDLARRQPGLLRHRLEVRGDHAVDVEASNRGGLIQHAAFDLGADPDPDHDHGDRQNDQAHQEELGGQRQMGRDSSCRPIDATGPATDARGEFDCAAEHLRPPATTRRRRVARSL